MGIKDYLAILYRRLGIVILVPLIATGVSALMVFLYLNLYMNPQQPFI